MYYANVIEITDGDTFRIDHERKRIRIANFDAPEKGQPGYEQATQKLHNLIYGRQVGIEERAIDKFGRTVADVSLGGTPLTNLL